ncbi:hypothetical protein D3C86_1379510 [compost metagenome]
MRIHKESQRTKIKEEIKNSLLLAPKSLHDLIDSLTLGTEKRRIEIVRDLLDAEVIRLEDKLYSWNTLF